MDQPFLSLNLLVSGAILALFLSFSVFLKIVRSFTHIFTHTEHIHFIFDSSALCTDFETLVQRHVILGLLAVCVQEGKTKRTKPLKKTVSLSKNLL